MNDVLRQACESSLLLACGSTLLLGLGCIAVAAYRSPVHRQRLAELTVGGFLIWLVLTLVPLPRLASPWFGSRDGAPARIDVAAASSPVIEMLPVEPRVVSDLLPQADPFSSIPLPQETSGSLPDDSLALLPRLEGIEDQDGLGSPSYVSSEQLLPVTTPTNAAASMSAPRLVTVLVGIYLAGSAACVGLLVVGYFMLLWIRATGQQPPAWLNTDYQQLAGKAHVSAAELLMSQRCSRPISWGLLWPAIVLPDRLCREASRRLVGAILLHELGHVARRDAWGNLLFCLATPLLYCHPLYWWLRREWNLAAELVADDWAAWQTGKDAYVEELMDLARTSPGGGLPFVGATAVFSSPSQFYRRMQMLLTREQPLSTRTSVVWQMTAIGVALLGIILASSLGGVRPAIAQDKPGSPPQPPPALDLPVVDPNLVPREEAPALELPVLPEPPTPAAADPRQPPQPPLPPVPPAAPKADVPNLPARGDAFDPYAPGTKPRSPEAIIQQLRAERAQLEAQLRAIQARLKELAPDSAGNAAPKLPVNANGSIEMTRVDKDGTLWRETWTADKNGQPAKLMARSAVATEPTADGKVVKTFEEKDGTITVKLYDAATGKVIETRRELPKAHENPGNNQWPSIPSPGNDVNLPLPQSKPDNEARARPRIGVVVPREVTALPTPETVGSPNAVVPTTSAAPVPDRAPGLGGQRELDLITLATSYADAVSNMETAQAKLADIEATEAKVSGTIPQQEITSARLALAAAKRKEQLLQRIARVALEGVSKELEHAVELHRAGIIPANGLEEKRTRTEILKQILSTQPDKPATGGQNALERK